MKTLVSRIPPRAKPAALLTSAQRSIDAAHRATYWRLRQAFTASLEALDRQRTRRAIVAAASRAPREGEALALRVLQRACREAFPDKTAMSAGLSYSAIISGRVLLIALSTNTPALDERAAIKLETA